MEVHVLRAEVAVLVLHLLQVREVQGPVSLHLQPFPYVGSADRRPIMMRGREGAMYEVPCFCFRCGRRLGKATIREGAGNAAFDLCLKCREPP